MFESGVHSPAVIRWPQGGLTGGRKYDGLMGHLDMFPTFMAMAGFELPPTRPLEGKNIWPSLRDNRPSPVDSYYWVLEKYDVVRTADWKLFRYAARMELYDMQNDPNETADVAGQQPDVVKTMLEKMEACRRSTGVALAHQPPQIGGALTAEPQGEVLEFRVTLTKPTWPKEALRVQFAESDLPLDAGDYVEYDFCVAPDSLPSGFCYSPAVGRQSPLFELGLGIDQFGREQFKGPAPWKGRAIGNTASSACAVRLRKV